MRPSDNMERLQSLSNSSTQATNCYSQSKQTRTNLISLGENKPLSRLGRLFISQVNSKGRSPESRISYSPCLRNPFCPRTSLSHQETTKIDTPLTGKRNELHNCHQSS